MIAYHGDVANTTDALPTEAIKRLEKDLIKGLRLGTKIWSREQVRFAVDLYYQIQELRKAAGNQVGAIERRAEEQDKEPEPNELLQWIFSSQYAIEKQIKLAMDAWTDAEPTARVMKQAIGIGPCISAGVCAHIDMTIAKSVSSLWRFAGLDPTQRWEKKKRRPWNASLKTLVWKMADVAKRMSGNPRAFYGKYYTETKAKLVTKSEAGGFAANAAAALATGRDWSKDHRAAYEAGKLPPAHLDNWALRMVSKLFLSHWWEVAYRNHHGTEPPAPWVIAHGGHIDLIRFSDVLAFEAGGSNEESDQ